MRNKMGFLEAPFTNISGQIRDKNPDLRLAKSSYREVLCMYNKKCQNQM